MKVRLLMASGLFCILALTSGAMRAQDHGQDQDHHDQDRRGQDHHDQDHSRFDDHETAKFRAIGITSTITTPRRA